MTKRRKDRRPARWVPGPGVVAGVDRSCHPVDHAKRAGSLAWYARHGGLTIGDHRALQHHVTRLAEQLHRPTTDVACDVVEVAKVASSAPEAGRQLVTVLGVAP